MVSIFNNIMTILVVYLPVYYEQQLIIIAPLITGKQRHYIGKYEICWLWPTHLNVKKGQKV